MEILHGEVEIVLAENQNILRFIIDAISLQFLPLFELWLVPTWCAVFIIGQRIASNF